MGEKRVFEGKTTNEAIEKGLKELNVSKKDVEIRIIESDDKRSFFSILAPRVVKVELTVKDTKQKNDNKEEHIEVKKEEKIINKEVIENSEKKIKEFLKEFFEKMKLKNINYEIKNDEKNTIYVNINGEDANFLIGYRGEVLNALQTYLVSVAGKDIKDRIYVIVDVLGYREKRKKVLEDLATRVANNVVRNRKSVTLDPMTAYERKIIHTKLQEHTKVKTVSIGEGDHRRVVISLK